KFGNPDFVKFAESMGLKGYRVEQTSDFVPILKEALQQKVPAIIDCQIDYRENLRLSKKLGELSCKI
ncbi:MAG TPA: thiamine pyrophosphate-dependent enzyme, partial [Allocoleopsis sp.]